MDDPDQLALDLLNALGRVRRHTRRSVGRPWPIDSVTGSQVELLRVVRRQPGISVAEAAGELGLAANSVSTLVRQLTELHLLQRTRDDSDKRIARLTLTDTARTRVEEWSDRRSALVAAVVGALADADRQALAAAIPSLVALADALQPDTRDSPDSSDMEVAS